MGKVCLIPEQNTCCRLVKIVGNGCRAAVLGAVAGAAYDCQEQSREESKSLHVDGGGQIKSTEVTRQKKTGEGKPILPQNSKASVCRWLFLCFRIRIRPRKQASIKVLVHVVSNLRGNLVLKRTTVGAVSLSMWEWLALVCCGGYG